MPLPGVQGAGGASGSVQAIEGDKSPKTVRTSQPEAPSLSHEKIDLSQLPPPAQSKAPAAVNPTALAIAPPPNGAGGVVLAASAEASPPSAAAGRTPSQQGTSSAPSVLPDRERIPPGLPTSVAQQAVELLAQSSVPPESELSPVVLPGQGLFSGKTYRNEEEIQRKNEAVHRMIDRFASVALQKADTLAWLARLGVEFLGAQSTLNPLNLSSIEGYYNKDYYFVANEGLTRGKKLHVPLTSSTSVRFSNSNTRNLTGSARAALVQMRRLDPSLDRLMRNAEGYVVFPSSADGGSVGRAANTQGVVFRGDAVVGYAERTAGSTGTQAGAQPYDELVVFENSRSLNGFLQGGLRLGEDASAVVLKKGAAAETPYDGGVVIFARPNDGAAAQPFVGGQTLRFIPRESK